MRVRMIRPAYWTDADLHTRLSAEVREFYIGLWMLADDGGYVPWDINRVGAELYPYRAQSWRVRRLAEWVVLLAPHARILECGQHLVIPSLPKHQAPPKPSFQVQRQHDACMRQMAPHGATGDHGAPAQEGKGREGKGIGLKGGAPRDFETHDETEFSRRVPIAVALGGHKA